ncbi:hypothetical protein GQ54DRAFT_314468 [Martensiomyces pterosporus]|nr:hypothetical protein GQ54DRAFT_314468 [Martensiomyces pterosporus]
MFGASNTSNTASGGSGGFQFGGFGGGGSTGGAPASTFGQGSFGATNTSSAPTFGSTATNTAPAAPAFGTPSFGSNTNAGAAGQSIGGGGLFGSSNAAGATSAAGGGTSLFGSTTNAASSGSGLFGSGNTATSAVTSTAGGGLFGSGNTAATTTTGGGLFGSSSTAATSAAGGGLFGSSSTAPTSTIGGGLFGNKAAATTTTAAPAFGSTATAATAAPAAPGITRKTKFVDLPEAVQKTLEEIERHKQVQIQIGDSIMTDETEKELKQVTRTVQKLAHELHVVKMTLAGDRERVDDAKQQVNFAVNHAEKGASLVAHATDDGSWGQSGLTPLQVATRQRTLLALQNGDPVAGAPLLFSQLNQQGFDNDPNAQQQQQQQQDQQQQQQAEAKPANANEGSTMVDPFEAVRRIQFASMHLDVASEYYWEWLSRVETSAQLLAERLDQLERHVGTAVAKTQNAGDAAQSGRPTPKAVSDIIQYQNDSFLAIAGKLAAVDEDVRRLKKKIAAKAESND